MKAARTARLGLLALAWALSSCAEDEKLTALVVVVDSDIADLDAVRVDVMRFGNQRLPGAALGPGTAPLPRRLGLVHRGGPLGPIEIAAEGLRDGEVVVVKRQARVFFVRDRVMMLRLNLLRSCIDKMCDAGETCGEIGCRDIDLAANELTEWTGEIPPLVPVGDLDAGSDGGDDGSLDGGDADTADADVDADLPDTGPLPPACRPDRGNCDLRNDNGCETDLRGDPDHCGACGEACPAVGSLEVTGRACVNGECAVSCDAAEHGDCDRRAVTGCETDLQTTLAHCGACDAACPEAATLDIVTSECMAGACQITCDDVDHGNCDTLASTGCETDLQTTQAHCGACDAACPEAATIDAITSTCVNGTCQFTCDDVDHGDCDTLASTGCETDLQTTVAHCGACNAPCPAAGTMHIDTSDCLGGACALLCDPEWENFDTQLSTGCETSSPLFDFTPSNFDPALPELGLANRAAPTINCAASLNSGMTGTTVAPVTWCGVTVTPHATTQPGGGEVVIVPLSSLSVTSTGTLTLTGQRPVIFAVFGDVSIQGRIDASAVLDVSGAGGNLGCGTSTGGAGTNGGGGGGGGGGGFTTAGGGGGDGGSPGQDGGTAGVLRASAALAPLIAGCSGGKGGDGIGAGGAGGGGGGAFQISATGSLSLAATAVLAAAGGGGRASTSQESGGGGGGSGGAILLEADTVSAVAGAWLTANGGGGAEGNETDSTLGVTGSNGAAASATPASGGAGGEFDAGNGGAGGVQGTAPGGGNDGSSLFTTDTDQNDDGGGGGGGSVGRIHVRGHTDCTLAASFSPTASQACN